MDKIRIIDLLNKIANGEEVPKKIKYQNVIYIYYERLNDMFNYKSDDKRHRFLEEDYYIENILNDEVEILEEEKKIPEKLENEKKFYAYTRYEENKDEIDKVLYILKAINLTEEKIDNLNNSVNEIIDYLKSKGE